MNLPKRNSADGRCYWMKTKGFELLPLPGHFFDMVGFRTPDDVVYLADCHTKSMGFKFI